MSKKSAPLGVLGVLIAAVIVSGALPQAGPDLFQKALRLETNEGKWQQAIELYRDILKRFPDDRELAAEAQFRIGMCYERLGNEEAQNAYQAVIQSYAEQKAVVAKAQDRLSRLARPAESPQGSEGIRVLQVWKKQYLDSLGSVSPDGRFLAFVDWGEGDVALHDLASGENRVLAHPADLKKGGFAQEPLFSPSGRRIAYSWWNSGHTYDLFAVDVSDPEPRRLYRKEGEHVYPATWISDDELVFTSLNYETKRHQVCSLNISSGDVRVLRTLQGRPGGAVSASPDGKFLAYSFPNAADKGNADINLLALDGSGEVPLVEHPANDVILGWVPNRKDFLFTSDRSGTWDLWAVTVEGGKASGPTRRIYTDIGMVSPVGFTRNGDGFVGFSRRSFNALLAPFDPGTGQVHEKTGRDLLGSNYGIKWSPDGRYVSYIRMDRNVENPMRLIVQDMSSGESREMADDLWLVQAPRWSPDGDSLLAVGFMKNDRTKSAGIYIVDVPTGKARQVLNLLDYKGTVPPPGDDAFPLSDIEWSSDGKSIFYLFFTDRLVRRDFATGEERVLYKHPRFERDVLGRSPDGKSLFFAVRVPEDGKSHLYTMSAEGNNIKELCAAQESNRFEMGMWSPDGKYVYFVEEKDGGTSLWRIAAAGGVPQKTWQSKVSARIFGFHPEGQQVSLAIYVPELEIRVIKNLVRELERLDQAAR